MLETTYTQARANLAGLCGRITDNREIVLITRRNGESVAMVAADELRGLMETAHLLRSSKNATRLLSALDRALKKTGRSTSVDRLRREMGLEK